ncbi:MAG: hypothetical protein AAF502_17575 [Bacteroidota bacterium]
MKSILTFLLLYFFTYAFGQTNYYALNGHKLSVFPDELNWFSINFDNSITDITAEIRSQINAKESIFKANANSVLIVGSKEKLSPDSGINITDDQRILKPKSRFELSESELLMAITLKNDAYALLVANIKTYEEAIIFRNCHKPKNKPSLGCGNPPFIIEFYGDLTNDGIPEMLLSASKEDGGVFKLLIGKTGAGYKVLFSSEKE